VENIIKPVNTVGPNSFLKLFIGGGEWSSKGEKRGDKWGYVTDMIKDVVVRPHSTPLMHHFSEALIRAVNAGCNILTLSNNARTYDEEAVYKALDIIIHAVRSGKISLDKINNSYRKIIDLKTKYNLMTFP